MAKTKAAKKENNTEKIRVYLSWASLACDPIQFKPSNPVFHPINVKVYVDVPNTPDLVESHDGDSLVLTIKGMMYCANYLRNNIAASYRTN